MVGRQWWPGRRARMAAAPRSQADRPIVDSQARQRARIERPTQQCRAPSAGERAQLGKQPENKPSTDFKALKKTKPLIQFPNHLCYTLEGILGY